MNMSSANRPLIVQPDGGKALHAFGDVLSVLLGGDQTGGKLALMFDVTPPGGGPPPHVHSQEDELFLIADGKVSFLAEGIWTEVRPGGAIYLPKGCPHTYRNIGTTESRVWILTFPSGFETFFARCAAEFASPSGPNMQRIVEISREHGIEYLTL